LTTEAVKIHFSYCFMYICPPRILITVGSEGKAPTRKHKVVLS
jgi:hypothetical protein